MDEDITIELDNDNAEVELENTDTIYKALYDYNDLDGKPSINNVTLVGNKTSSQLGLANESDVTRIDDNIGGTEYDDTATYELGDIVKHHGKLYLCIEAIETPEEWDNTHWSETDVLSSAGGNEIAIGDNTNITGRTKIFIEEETKRLKYKDSITGQFENIAGDEIAIGTDEDVTEDTKLLIELDEPDIVSEVVDSLEGNETTKAPSVKAVNDLITENGVIVSSTEPTTDRKKVWLQYGKNLWGGFTYNTTNNGINFIQNSNGSIKIDGIASNNAYPYTANSMKSSGYYKILEPGTYTISGYTEDIDVQCYGLMTSNTLLADRSNPTFTLTETSRIMLRPYILAGTTISNQTIYMQVEEGLVATDFKEYLEDKIFILNNNVYNSFENIFYINDILNKLLLDTLVLEKILFLNPPNWNDLCITGKSSVAFATLDTLTAIGAPRGAYTYGTLFTINSRDYKEYNFNTVQIYIPDNPYNSGIYIRTRGNRNWANFSGTTVNQITE